MKAEERRCRPRESFPHDHACARATCERFQQDLHGRDLMLVHEDVHGDGGSGIGASHQPGRTGLVARLIEPSGE